MASWIELFGDELLTQDGVVNTEDALAAKTIIGVYFSAKSCLPCRAFTPLLATVYDDMVEEYPGFEIVYVSSDETELEFIEYLDEMPWKAMRFSDADKRQELKDDYTSLIPWLAFLNDKGEFLTEDGRAIVTDAQGDVKRIWETLVALKK